MPKAPGIFFIKGVGEKMQKVTPEQLTTILLALKERYTIRYLADVLSVTRPTIYNWAKQLSFPSQPRLRKVLYLARLAKIDGLISESPVKRNRYAHSTGI